MSPLPAIPYGECVSSISQCSIPPIAQLRELVTRGVKSLSVEKLRELACAAQCDDPTNASAGLGPHIPLRTSRSAVEKSLSSQKRDFYRLYHDLANLTGFESSDVSSSTRVQLAIASLASGMPPEPLGVLRSELTNFSVAGYSVGDMQAEALAIALDGINQLAIMDLSSARFHVPQLASVLRKAQPKHLQLLNVSRCVLQGPAISALASVLRNAPLLRAFIADGCKLGDLGAAALLFAMAEECSLELLSMRENQLADRSAVAISALVAGSNATTAIEAQVRADEAEDRATTRAAAAAGSDVLHTGFGSPLRVRPVSELPSIQPSRLYSLALGGNSIPAYGCALIFRAVAASETMRLLDVAHAVMSSSHTRIAIAALCDMLSEGCKLVHVDISHTGVDMPGCVMLADALAGATSVLGLHAAGLPVLADARGFLVPRAAEDRIRPKFKLLPHDADTSAMYSAALAAAADAQAMSSQMSTPGPAGEGKEPEPTPAAPSLIQDALCVAAHPAWARSVTRDSVQFFVHQDEEGIASLVKPGPVLDGRHLSPALTVGADVLLNGSMSEDRVARWALPSIQHYTPGVTLLLRAACPWLAFNWPEENAADMAMGHIEPRPHTPLGIAELEQQALVCHALRGQGHDGALAMSKWHSQHSPQSACACWMCGAWQQHTFRYTPGVSGPPASRVALLCSVDSWRPMPMAWNPSTASWELPRRLPPATVAFVFVVDGVIRPAMDYSTRALSYAMANARAGLLKLMEAVPSCAPTRGTGWVGAGADTLNVLTLQAPLMDIPSAVLAAAVMSRPSTAASFKARSRPGTARSKPGTARSRPGTARSRPGTAASADRLADLMFTADHTDVLCEEVWATEGLDSQLPPHSVIHRCRSARRICAVPWTMMGPCTHLPQHEMAAIEHDWSLALTSPLQPHIIISTDPPSWQDARRHADGRPGEDPATWQAQATWLKTLQELNAGTVKRALDSDWTAMHTLSEIVEEDVRKALRVTMTAQYYVLWALFKAMCAYSAELLNATAERLEAVSVAQHIPGALKLLGLPVPSNATELCKQLAVPLPRQRRYSGPPYLARSHGMDLFLAIAKEFAPPEQAKLSDKMHWFINEQAIPALTQAGIAFEISWQRDCMLVPQVFSVLHFYEVQLRVLFDSVAVDHPALQELPGIGGHACAGISMWTWLLLCVLGGAWHSEWSLSIAHLRMAFYQGAAPVADETNKSAPVRALSFVQFAQALVRLAHMACGQEKSVCHGWPLSSALATMLERFAGLGDERHVLHIPAPVLAGMVQRVHAGYSALGRMTGLPVPRSASAIQHVSVLFRIADALGTDVVDVLSAIKACKAAGVPLRITQALMRRADVLADSMCERSALLLAILESATDACT